MPSYYNQSKGVVYGTPKWVIDEYLPKEYLDVAPYPWNKEKWNGLTMDWSENLVNYCNPPFRDLCKGWSKKNNQEALLG